MLSASVLGLVLLLSQSAPGDKSAPPAENADAAMATPGDQDNIVVEAPNEGRERRNELRRMARSVLNEAKWDEPIASYSAAICPKVFGLPEAQAVAIETRIRENAVALGANRRDQQDDCEHNISVIFLAEDQGRAETWLDYDSDALEHLLSYERARVLQEEGPVRAWNYRIERTPDGLPVQASPRGALDPRLIGNFAVRSGLPTNLRSSISIDIEGSVVMIELQSAQGKTLTQLADYASMRSFGNTRGIKPETVLESPTILTLFQDDEPPQELTAFDRSLISGLYDTDRSARQTSYYGNIAKRAARLEQEGREAAEQATQTEANANLP